MDTPRLLRSADYDRLGQDRRKLATLHHRGEIVRIRRGIYVRSTEWNGLQPKEQYGLRALALAQAAENKPVFCHATAALLWGLWIVGIPQKLHSVTEVATSGRSTSSVVRHVASLSKGVKQCGPFLLTDKLTTTLQLVSTFSFPYAVAVCDSSLRLPENRGLVNQFTAPGVNTAGHMPLWEADCPQGPALSVDELRAGAGLMRSKAARKRVLAVIEFASGLSGSAGESLSRAKMFQLGFPAPVLQKRFVLRDGSDAFVDFWFEEQQVVAEFDGKGKYLRSDWGGGLSLQARIIAEKQREDQIRAYGVGFTRWDWKEMMNRDRLTYILRQAGLPQT